MSLTDEEVKYLDKYSGVKPNPEALLEARQKTIIDTEQELNSQMTIEEVAQLLGITNRQVFNGLQDKKLYATSNLGKQYMFPAYQFRGNKVIPHFVEILKELPKDLNVLSVIEFFENAVVDDDENDTEANMAEWLLAGNDPKPAIALAKSQHYSTVEKV